MPVDKQVTLRYQVLNKCFRDLYNEYTIDDLVKACNAALRRADRPEVSKRTVQSDIANMETDYGIRLDENRFRGRKRLYRYYDTSYTLPQFQMDDGDRFKIQAAVNVLENYEGEPVLDWARTLLMQIGSGVFGSDSSSVVSFQSNPDLKGISLFSDLLKAIIDKRTLKLTYTPFGKSTFTTDIYPYFLKQYNDRWYLIAQAIGYTGYAHYALDRIDDFKETELPYLEAEVNFEEYFDEFIGITDPGTESEDIIIKVKQQRYHYIKTKPLHLSQRVLEETPDHAVISINVRINKELESQLLSFGDDIEVLSPEDFRNKIAEKIRSMNQNYQNDEENLHT